MGNGLDKINALIATRVQLGSNLLPIPYSLFPITQKQQAFGLFSKPYLLRLLWEPNFKGPVAKVQFIFYEAFFLVLLINKVDFVCCIYCKKIS